MKTLEFHGNKPDARYIAQAVEALQRGEIIIYPTDSLYALGCDALNQRAIEALCKIKGINPDKELLSIVCADLSQASQYARIDNHAFRLLKTNLPGPFTFILPADTRLPKVFKGRRSVGVRIPDHAVARALASELGHPVLSTSVTVTDNAEAVEPASIAMYYEGKAAMMLDAGPGALTPSAVVNATDSSAPEIVREGPAELLW